MSNEFYTPSGLPATRGALSSSRARAEFADIEDGFDMLPNPSTIKGWPVFGKADGSALEGVDPATARNRLSFTPYYPLLRPRHKDLTTTNANLKGFVSGFTDGLYGYFAQETSGTPGGMVAKLSLADFSTTTYVDLSSTNANLKGFSGACTDGRYAYFAPNNNGSYHGYVAKLDLSDFSTVTYLDLSLTNVNLKGFTGCFTDGTYVYFVPNYNGAYHGYVARVSISDFSTVSFINLGAISANYKGFWGGFTDGRYAYLTPLNNGSAHGNVIRIDVTNFSSSGVTALDLSSTNANLKGFAGGCTDGRYGYFIPNVNGSAHGYLARVDLLDFSSVSYLNLVSTNSNLKGYAGGFIEGRYLYAVPWFQGATAHGYLARVDLADFQTVSYIDMTVTNSNLKGYVGGFQHDGFGYLVPYYNSAYQGNVVRINLFGGNASGI